MTGETPHYLEAGRFVDLMSASYAFGEVKGGEYLTAQQFDADTDFHRLFTDLCTRFIAGQGLTEFFKPRFKDQRAFSDGDDITREGLYTKIYDHIQLGFNNNLNSARSLED